MREALDRTRTLVAARVVSPIRDQLTQGLSPDSVALTLALGLCLAIVPVLGATTFLCGGAALLLRLNQPVIQSVNFLAYPLQLVLMIPFLHLGRVIFGGPRVTWTVAEIATIASREPVRAARILGAATLGGVGAWLLACVPLFALLYLGSRRLLRLASHRLRSPQAG